MFTRTTSSSRRAQDPPNLAESRAAPAGKVSVFSSGPLPALDGYVKIFAWQHDISNPQSGSAAP
jgi:hypothetical protein